MAGMGHAARTTRPEKTFRSKGLAETLSAVLELHRGLSANKAVLAGKQPRPTEYKVPDDFPSLKGEFQPELDFEGKLVKSCMHCHQIRDAHRQIIALRENPSRIVFCCLIQVLT